MQPSQNKLHSRLLTAVTDMPSVLLHWISSFRAFTMSELFVNGYFSLIFLHIFFGNGSIIYYKMDHLAHWAAAHMGAMGR